MSVPVVASVVVANSTIPFTVSEASSTPTIFVKLEPPSTENSNLSVFSLNCNIALAVSPLSTSIPDRSVVAGVPVWFLLSVIILSSTSNVAVLTVVVVPLTVKLPVTVKSPDVVTVTSVASPIVKLSDIVVILLLN